MESGNTSSSTPASILNSSEHYKFHLSNIQLLASIDCALALTTLVFNLKQVVFTVGNFVKQAQLDENNAIDDDKEGPHIRLVAAAIASVCLTLTQLLLACLVMMSLSKRERDRTLQSGIHIIPGIWTLWSILLLIVLIIYASRIKRFEDFGDQFYLFALISEIVLRISIISYTSTFFWCRCYYNRSE